MEPGFRCWRCTISSPIVASSAPSPNRHMMHVFRLTLPDARGHGASPMLSGRAYPSSELAADALAVLDAEGLQSAHLVAIGWAAETALALAATAPQRVASLVLAAPYLPALVADRAEAAARQIGSAHLEMMQEAAALAEKGQTDRALDLFLGARIGADWRDRFSKPRLGAIRRSAGNLAPLLAGMVGAPIDPDALTSLDMPVVLLVKDDAEILERVTVETLVVALASRADHNAATQRLTSSWLAARSGQRRSRRRWGPSAHRLLPVRMPLPNKRTSIVSGDDPERSTP